MAQSHSIAAKPGAPEGLLCAVLRQLRKRLGLVLRCEHRLDRDALVLGLLPCTAPVPVRLAALRCLPPRPCAARGRDVSASAEELHRQDAIIDRLSDMGFTHERLAALRDLPPRPCKTVRDVGASAEEKRQLLCQECLLSGIDH